MVHVSWIDQLHRKLKQICIGCSSLKKVVTPEKANKNHDIILQGSIIEVCQMDDGNNIGILVKLIYRDLSCSNVTKPSDHYVLH